MGYVNTSLGRVGRGGDGGSRHTHSLSRSTRVYVGISSTRSPQGPAQRGVEGGASLLHIALDAQCRTPRGSRRAHSQKTRGIIPHHRRQKILYQHPHAPCMCPPYTERCSSPPLTDYRPSRPARAHHGYCPDIKTKVVVLCGLESRAYQARPSGFSIFLVLSRIRSHDQLFRVFDLTR